MLHVFHAIKTNKNTKKFTVLTKSQPFFLHKHFLNHCKSLVNFQSLGKLILTILASFLIAFMEEILEILTLVFFFQYPCFHIVNIPVAACFTTWGKVKIIITPGH